MKPVFQTRYGGSDAPLAEQGNCFQACVASIFELPLEEAFDLRPYPADEWFDAFNKWLVKYNLACTFIPSTEKEPLACTVPIGYHIFEVLSKTLSNTDDRHAIVICDNVVVHNPNAKSQGLGEAKGFYLFLCKEPWLQRAVL